MLHGNDRVFGQGYCTLSLRMNLLGMGLLAHPVFSDMRRGALDLMYVQVHMVSSTTVRKALKSKSADIAERNSPTGRGLDQSQIALLCWSS